MAYGVVPVARAVSSIPHHLEGFGVGRAVDPNDREGFVEAISAYVREPRSGRRSRGERWKRPRVSPTAAISWRCEECSSWRRLDRQRTFPPGGGAHGGGVVRLDLAVSLRRSAHPARAADSEVLALRRLARVVCARRRPPPGSPARRWEMVACAAAYISGAEVFWRMRRVDIPWEFGKYAVFLVLAVALVRTARVRRSWLPVAYFLAPVPSGSLTLLSLDAGRGPGPAELQPLRPAEPRSVRAVLLDAAADEARAPVGLRLSDRLRSCPSERPLSSISADSTTSSSAQRRAGSPAAVSGRTRSRRPSASESSPGSSGWSWVPGTLRRMPGSSS